MSTRSRGGAVLAVLGLLGFGAGCHVSLMGDDGEECCHYEMRTTGGSQSSFTAEVVLHYESATIAHDTSDLTSQAGQRMDVSGALPIGWTAPLDAGANDAGDAGLDLGSPHGWGNHGRVAVIDLGDTPATHGGALVNAKIISCPHPYDALVTSGTGHECVSGIRRPALIELLTGRRNIDGAVTTLEATTASGAKVNLRWASSKMPINSYPVCTSASLSC